MPGLRLGYSLPAQLKWLKQEGAELVQEAEEAFDVVEAALSEQPQLAGQPERSSAAGSGLDDAGMPGSSMGGSGSVVPLGGSSSTCPSKAVLLAAVRRDRSEVLEAVADCVRQATPGALPPTASTAVGSSAYGMSGDFTNRLVSVAEAEEDAEEEGGEGEEGGAGSAGGAAQGAGQERSGEGAPGSTAGAAAGAAEGGNCGASQGAFSASQQQPLLQLPESEEVGWEEQLLQGVHNLNTIRRKLACSLAHWAGRLQDPAGFAALCARASGSSATTTVRSSLDLPGGMAEAMAMGATSMGPSVTSSMSMPAGALGAAGGAGQGEPGTGGPERTGTSSLFGASGAVQRLNLITQLEAEAATAGSVPVPIVPGSAGPIGLAAIAEMVVRHSAGGVMLGTSPGAGGEGWLAGSRPPNSSGGGGGGSMLLEGTLSVVGLATAGPAQQQQQQAAQQQQQGAAQGQGQGAPGGPPALQRDGSRRQSSAGGQMAIDGRPVGATPVGGSMEPQGLLGGSTAPGTGAVTPLIHASQPASEVGDDEDEEEEEDEEEGGCCVGQCMFVGVWLGCAPHMPHTRNTECMTLCLCHQRPNRKTPTLMRTAACMGCLPHPR